MTRINLLPWRDALRKERQKRFFVATAIAVIFMGIIVGLVHLYHVTLINNQLQRNALLQNEITVLEGKIKEIEELEREKENILARMTVIQDLQSRRPLVVHTLDELVTTLPDGVYLTLIENRGTNLKMEGVAQSNARVSSYMRNIEKNEWLRKPVLDIIETSTPKKSGQRGEPVEPINRFILKASQNIQTEQTEQGGQAK